MTTRKNPNQRLIDRLTDLAGEELTLGTFLRAIRLGEEVSQTEFADWLGISRQFLCDLEKGRKFLSPRMAVDYAECLGYCPEQFLRLCLQDMIDRGGLDYAVCLEAA